MRHPEDSSARPAPPTNKARTAVQRAVMDLLDQLAPIRTLPRTERPPVPLERHRSPTGCVLQAANYAVSVSWFNEEKGGSLGELHVIVWRGTVARPGATRHTKGATIVSEMTFYPIEPPEDGRVWRGEDGTRYDSIGLVAMILSLAEQQEREPK